MGPLGAEQSHHLRVHRHPQGRTQFRARKAESAQNAVGIQQGIGIASS